VSAPVLERPELELERRTFAASDPGFAEFELGARALADALRLSEGGASGASALVLLRTAVLSLASARRARSAAQRASPSPDESRWNGLLQVTDAVRVIERLSADQRALLEQLLAPDFDPGQLLRLTAGERERGLIVLRRLCFALGDPLANAASAVRRRRTVRRVRAAALAGLLVFGLGWGLAKALQRPNLALHKPVLVKDADPTIDVDHAQLVDGNRTNLGFHSLARGDKSVVIDLLAPHLIRRVDVYNRMDCCQERAVPLAIEVSSDGQTFRPVAHQGRRFALWKASFPPVDARWVRLTQSSDQPFHLSEVEIY
jgi:hypothetical protein